MKSATECYDVKLWSNMVSASLIYSTIYSNKEFSTLRCLHLCSDVNILPFILYMHLHMNVHILLRCLCMGYVSLHKVTVMLFCKD
jgi:hypothetical protein